MSEIKVVPYDYNWPRYFEEAAKKIKVFLGSNLIDIHHVGSTSVPGLVAKEKIDIIAVVKNGADTVNLLESAGYIYKGEWNIPLKYGFTYRPTLHNPNECKVNLHVLEEGHPEIQSNILFRDYLRDNSNARYDYIQLKHNILKDPAANEKSHLNLYKYTLQKGGFIRECLKKAGFNALRILIMSNETERTAARKYRRAYLDNKQGEESYNRSSLDSADWQHFILYKGVEIIGYACVHLHTQIEDTISSLIVDKEKEGHGYDREFAEMLQKWINRRMISKELKYISKFE